MVLDTNGDFVEQIAFFADKADKVKYNGTMTK